MTLLNRHLAVVTVSVGVLKRPGKSRRFPLTVSRVQRFLDLFSMMSQTRRPYSLFLPLGTTDSFSKKMVLVPSIQLPTPCASRPSLLAKDFLQISFSLPFMRWRYSWAWMVIGRVTEFASAIAI